MLAVFNFDSAPVENYRVELGAIDAARLVLDTNWDKYGGEVEHQPQWLELEYEGLTLTLEPFSGKLFTLQRGADYVVTLDDDQPDAIEGVDEILPQPEEPLEEPEAAPEGQEIAAAVEEDEEVLAQAVREHNKWFRSLPREEQERLFLKSARGRNNYGKQGKDTEDKPETEAEK
jgi:hypothetical protein